MRPLVGKSENERRRLVSKILKLPVSAFRIKSIGGFSAGFKFSAMKDLKNVPANTITRDVKDLAQPTGNIYESVVVLYKRANQIALEEKKELAKKLEDFRNERESMDEIFENKEQIEISKHYEKLPKPSLIAIEEFKSGELTYREAGEPVE